MNYLTVPNVKAQLRDFGTANDLDVVYAMALDAAEATIDKFVGFDVWVEFGGMVPVDVIKAGYLLAVVDEDALDPTSATHARARAESLLRPHRREVGFAGSGSEVPA